MLRGWNVAIDSEGVLKKIIGKDGWDAGAVLEVGDPARFEASVSFSEGSLPLILGITKTSVIGSMKEKPGKDEDLPKMFVKANGSSCFVFVDDDRTTHALNYDSSSPEVLSRIAVLGRIDARLAVRYRDGKVSFASGDRALEPLEVPDQDYRPCIFLHEKHTSVALAISRKRGRAQEICDRLWRGRRHTDATLVCPEHKVHVHRDILSAASPVFERMWSGAYREANESTVEIADVPGDIVEAMVQHMYTGIVPPHGDPTQLYSAAKKYELDELAEEVGKRLLDSINLENVQERARVLRRHATAGDTQAKQLWERMYKKLQGNPQLLQCLVEGLLP